MKHVTNLSKSVFVSGLTWTQNGGQVKATGFQGKNSVISWESKGYAGLVKGVYYSNYHCPFIRTLFGIAAPLNSYDMFGFCPQQLREPPPKIGGLVVMIQFNPIYANTFRAASLFGMVLTKDNLI